MLPYVHILRHFTTAGATRFFSSWTWAAAFAATWLQVLKGRRAPVDHRKRSVFMSTIIKHKQFPKNKKWTMDCAAVP